MIGYKVKPSQKLTGLRYSWNDKIFGGTLYTAMPLRIITAAQQALKWSFISMAVLFGLADMGGMPFDFVSWAGFSLLAALPLYPVFLILAPGKQIRMSHDTLRVGWKKYDLGSLGTFRSVPMSDKKQHVQYLVFDYGTKFVKVPVKNRADHQMLISQTLNELREIIQRQPANFEAASQTPATLR